MNQVKFNRFEKYIPEATDNNGILVVSSDEKEMEYLDTKKYIGGQKVSNLLNGFELLATDDKTFTINKGIANLYTYGYLNYDINDYNINHVIESKEIRQHNIENLEDGKFRLYVYEDNGEINFFHFNKNLNWEWDDQQDIHRFPYYCRHIANFEISYGKVLSYTHRQSIIDEFNNRFLLDEKLGVVGYRVYSDGWKVQWGYGSDPTFPLQFIETPQIVYGLNKTEVSPTSMKCDNGYWMAKGY